MQKLHIGMAEDLFSNCEKQKSRKQASAKSKTTKIISKFCSSLTPKARKNDKKYRFPTVSDCDTSKLTDTTFLNPNAKNPIYRSRENGKVNKKEFKIIKKTSVKGNGNLLLKDLVEKKIGKLAKNENFKVPQGNMKNESFKNRAMFGSVLSTRNKNMISAPRGRAKSVSAGKLKKMRIIEKGETLNQNCCFKADQDSFNQVKTEKNVSFIDDLSDVEFAENIIENRDILEAPSFEKYKIEGVALKKSAILIQRNFRKYLIQKYLKSQKKNDKKCLSTITTNISIATNRLAKSLGLSKNDPISITSRRKPELNTQTESIFLTPYKVSNHSFIQELISFSLAQTKLVEHFYFEEINLVESIFSSEIDKLNSITKVNEKFKRIIKYLNDTSTHIKNHYLDSISIQIFSDIKKSQKNFEKNMKISFQPSPSLFQLIPVECDKTLTQSQSTKNEEKEKISNSYLPHLKLKTVKKTRNIFIFAGIVLNYLRASKLLEEVNKPIKKDPVEELSNIYLNKPRNFEKPGDSELSIIDIKSILTQKFEVNTEEHFELIHKKLILSVIDLILQESRPYGLKGEPHSWQNARKRNKVDMNKIVEKTLKKLELFCFFQMGKVSNEEMSALGATKNDRVIRALVEEKIEKAVIYEVVVEEDEWICYEFEEMQVVLDLSDLLTELLVEEIIFDLDNFA